MKAFKTLLSIFNLICVCYTPILFGQNLVNIQHDLHIPSNPDTSNPVTLWATHYYIHEAKYESTGFPLKGKDEKQYFTKVSLCDWCAAAIEGTVITTDSIGNSATLNFAGRGSQPQVDCSQCEQFKTYPNKSIRSTLWAKAKGPFGDGVKGNILIPYRTVAVDKDVFPIGTVFFIPLAQGIEIRLSDGNKMIHDGYFFSGDIGGDIKGRHIDVFTGLSKSNPFPFVTSNATEVFTAYIIKDKEINQQLQRIHRN